ncbi:hypothetical protein ES703_50137 [subsurface metagenome]
MEAADRVGVLVLHEAKAVAEVELEAQYLYALRRLIILAVLLK